MPNIARYYHCCCGFPSSVSKFCDSAVYNPCIDICNTCSLYDNRRNHECEESKPKSVLQFPVEDVHVFNPIYIWVCRKNKTASYPNQTSVIYFRGDANGVNLRSHFNFFNALLRSQVVWFRRYTTLRG